MIDNADCETLAVRLFGPTRIEIAGKRVVTRLRPGATVLLAMTLLHEARTIARDEAAFLLWPDVSESEARATLRRHLYLLQRDLPGAAGEWLWADWRTIGWREDAPIWVDAREFERPAADPEASLALYAGDFLPRIEHEWAEERREYFRVRACARLADLLRDASHRSIGERLRLAERLLVLDPWREDVFREAMLLRANSGDRAGAVAAYRLFCARLRAELDLGPMPETVRCFELLARGEITALAAEARDGFRVPLSVGA